jgi:hypothetical protein
VNHNVTCDLGNTSTDSHYKVSSKFFIEVRRWTLGIDWLGPPTIHAVYEPDGSAWRAATDTKTGKYKLAVASVETTETAAHYGTQEYNNGKSHFSLHCLHWHNPPIQNTGPQQVGSKVTRLACAWVAPISNLDWYTIGLRFLVVFAGKFWYSILNQAMTLFFPDQYHFTNCSFDAI